MEEDKKKIYMAVVTIAVIALGVVLYYKGGANLIGKIKSIAEPAKPRVIDENLKVPETQKITGSEGRFVTAGVINVSLMPKNDGEKVIVSKAILTVKGVYDIAAPKAQEWSSDAKLVFVKSLGAVTLDGQSSQWQLAFSAKAKKGKGYEIIVQGDKIVSEKAIESTAVGRDLPDNLKDSNIAVAALQTPQFSDATMSSINLYYNADGKIWRYAFATSKGVTTVAAE